MSLLRSISTFGGLTLVSRVLGFIRDVFIARYLGAGLVSDVFFVAFKLPNFFRRLFAEGAFSAAFVPIFCGLLGSGDLPERRQAAERFAEDAMAVLIAVLLVFTAVMQITMPWFMYVLAPGFSDDPEKFAMAIKFSRITFPYLMLISLVALMGGVLNGFGRFSAGAAAPILLNLTLIGSLLFFHGDDFETGKALSFSLPVAGILQLLWMLFGLKRAGFSPRLLKPKLTPRVRELGKTMLPIALGAGVMQINLVIDIVLSSFLPEGSLSFLYYADRLNQLPIGVIGVAVGTVLLPSLSRSLSIGKPKQANFDQNRAIEAALLLTIPAGVALVLIPDELITVLFQRGEFDAFDTAATSAALIAYVTGLPAYVLVKVLTPAYFSRRDTKTPVLIATLSLVINIILNLILMQFLAHVGLALATAIASWVNAALLYIILRKRGLFEADTRLKGKIWRICSAALVMGLVLVFAARLLAEPLSGLFWESLFALLFLVFLGLAVYAGAARLTGATTFAEVRQLLFIRGPKKQ